MSHSVEASTHRTQVLFSPNYFEPLSLLYCTSFYFTLAFAKSLLKKSGFYFDGFWYEKPVSPERYYSKVNFPEVECPVATEVAAQIINFPTYYKKSELEKAVKNIKPYLIEEGSK